MVITPFSDNGHLTRRESAFNVHLSRSRVKVEHAFGILKGQFRRLQHLSQSTIHFIPNIISDTDLDLAFPEIMDTSEVACRQDRRPQQANILAGKLR